MIEQFSARLAALRRLPRVQRAEAIVRDEDPRTLRHQLELARIGAPTSHEDARGARFAALLDDAIGSSATLDSVGNVLASTEGEEPPLVVAAHLDSVFPELGPVEIERVDDRWIGPGISDDARGLAVVLTVARALRVARLATRSRLVFAGTVGEEGTGNLRGVRALFTDEGRYRDSLGFISVDGAGIRRIVSRALASHRVRVRVRGPGGHTWTDRQTVNPIHALARLAAELVGRGQSVAPSSLTVARWGGGTAINQIPEDAWMDIDVRSEDTSTVSAIADTIHDEARRIVTEENARSGHEDAVLTLEIDPLGDRPGGQIAPDHPLFLAAQAATAALGVDPEPHCSSTDANIPMSLGIPALTLGGGGRAGSIHTSREWYDNRRGVDGVLRALWTILLFAGVSPTDPSDTRRAG
jgi:tripeptide aminopeptidase